MPRDGAQSSSSAWRNFSGSRRAGALRSGKVVHQLLSAGEPWAVKECDPGLAVSFGLSYAPERPGNSAADGYLARVGPKSKLTAGTNGPR